MAKSVSEISTFRSSDEVMEFVFEELSCISDAITDKHIRVDTNRLVVELPGEFCLELVLSNPPFRFNMELLDFRGKETTVWISEKVEPHKVVEALERQLASRLRPRLMEYIQEMDVLSSEWTAYRNESRRILQHDETSTGSKVEFGDTELQFDLEVDETYLALDTVGEWDLLLVKALPTENDYGEISSLRYDANIGYEAMLKDVVSMTKLSLPSWQSEEASGLVVEED